MPASYLHCLRAPRQQRAVAVRQACHYRRINDATSLVPRVTSTPVVGPSLAVRQGSSPSRHLIAGTTHAQCRRSGSAFSKAPLQGSVVTVLYFAVVKHVSCNVGQGMTGLSCPIRVWSLFQKRLEVCRRRKPRDCADLKVSQGESYRDLHYASLEPAQAAAFAAACPPKWIHTLSKPK